jgi:hypothetical protein
MHGLSDPLAEQCDTDDEGEEEEGKGSDTQGTQNDQVGGALVCSCSCSVLSCTRWSCCTHLAGVSRSRFTCAARCQVPDVHIICMPVLLSCMHQAAAHAAVSSKLVCIPAILHRPLTMPLIYPRRPAASPPLQPSPASCQPRLRPCAGRRTSLRLPLVPSAQSTTATVRSWSVRSWRALWRASGARWPASWRAARASRCAAADVAVAGCG